MTIVPARGFPLARALLSLAFLLAGSPAEAGASSRTSSLERPRSQPPLSSDSIGLGVVWTPPDAPGPALRQLNRIHALGATAVRLTRLPAADTLFTRADALGLHLFVDLPVAYVPAAALGNALSQAQSTVDRLRTLARRHPSVQHVGLARHADTTVPRTCSVLRAWTQRLHDAPSPVRTYYVTPFPAAVDRCGGAVDLVLLDRRGRADPVKRWPPWTTDTTRTGLGALGTWVRPGAGTGLRVPHSPERQARYLERSLSHLLDATPSPAALFVHRWQDAPRSVLSARRYGLHNADGTRRPVADVVEGVYTGTQQTFAFPSGTAPPQTPSILILFGWGLIALLAGLYAQSPFVRQTAYRYFAAHGFYRDAVRKGRDVNPLLNATLLLLATTAFGGILVLLARMAAATPTTEHVVAALPPALRAPVAAGLTQSGLAGAVASGMPLVLLVGWMLGLVLVARQETSFSLAQGLMLITWPCWPVLPGLIVALVAAAHSPVSPSLLWSLLFWGGLGTIISITVRVLRDFKHVTGAPLLRVLALAGLSPLALLLLTFAGLVIQYDLSLPFLWTLLTQT